MEPTAESAVYRGTYMHDYDNCRCLSPFTEYVKFYPGPITATYMNKLGSNVHMHAHTYTTSI